jgi:hypothetical protein
LTWACGGPWWTACRAWCCGAAWCVPLLGALALLRAPICLACTPRPLLRPKLARHPSHAQPDLANWLASAPPGFVRYLFWHGTGWRNVLSWLLSLAPPTAAAPLFMAKRPAFAARRVGGAWAARPIVERAPAAAAAAAAQAPHLGHPPGCAPLSPRSFAGSHRQAAQKVLDYMHAPMELDAFCRALVAFVRDLEAARRSDGVGNLAIVCMAVELPKANRKFIEAGNRAVCAVPVGRRGAACAAWAQRLVVRAVARRGASTALCTLAHACAPSPLGLACPARQRHAGRDAHGGTEPVPRGEPGDLRGRRPGAAGGYGARRCRVVWRAAASDRRACDMARGAGRTSLHATRRLRALPPR